MMDKLVRASASEIDQHKKLFGGFNDFPPGWSEISEKEFAKSGFGKSRVEYIEYRQMMYPKHSRSQTLRNNSRIPITILRHHINIHIQNPQHIPIKNIINKIICQRQPNAQGILFAEEFFVQKTCSFVFHRFCSRVCFLESWF